MRNGIVYGKYTFQDEEIKSGNLFLATSLLSAQLQVNTLESVVKCTDKAILDFERNSKLEYYYDNSQLAIFRVQTIERVGPELYHISATSTLGLLTEGQHMGGIYTGQTALEVIASICGTVPFAVKHNLEGIKLYGWLPIASPRDNLSQVLFAIGAALKTDLDGVLRIEGLWDGIAGTVTRDDIYNDATVDYDGKITQVIISEHQYVPWTEEQQLFEGTAQEGDIITFDEPMHTLTADGFAILDSGANWAKVSAGSGVLTGKTYLHNTRQVSRDVFTAREANIKTVEDATLVSLVNSQACAQRLADYYRCRERVDASVVYQGEKPGDRLATYHPFDKIGVAACLESADITLSNTLKAQEKSLVGFVPKQIEQTVTYDHHEVLTGSGEWIPPEGVTDVLAVLIGAGGAGFDGSPGIEGSGIGWGNSKRDSDKKSLPPNTEVSLSASATASSSGQISRGTGGAGGLAGIAGKILQINMEVESGNPISYSCGAAGLANGERGGETIFGQFTSENGDISQIGYTDLVSGETYAKPGINGSPGGNGGSPGSDGESVDSVAGGRGYSSDIVTKSKNVPGGSANTQKYYWGTGSANARISVPATGGGGAGGCSGKNLGNPGGAARGSSPTFDVHTSSGRSAYSYSGQYYGGNGGKGANGEDGKTYGCPGDGAGGGGGPGGCGQVSVTVQLNVTAEYRGTSTTATQSISVDAYAQSCDSGSVGPGGTGGAGAPGCIILYYGVKKKITTGQLVDKNHRMVLDRLGRRIIM